MTKDSDKHVYEVFEDMAERYPKRKALFFSEEYWTYGELNSCANYLAGLISQTTTGTGNLIGILVDRSAGVLISMLAVMKTGNTYVPLDPGTPESRLQIILEDSSPPLILTEGATHNRIVANYQLIQIDEIPFCDIKKQNVKDIPIKVLPEDIVYIIFTSGSTGRPKGVQVTHKGLDNFIYSMMEEPGFNPSDRILAITTISFDISGLELFLPLAAGASLLLLDKKESRDPVIISRKLEEFKCTVLQATPATWQMMIDSGWRGNPSLKALCGGEALSEDLAGNLLKKTGALWNMYGPTETTIWSTAMKIYDSKKISLGKPIANTALYVLDENMHECEAGQEGELYIGGHGLAKGYLNRPDLTEVSFVRCEAGKGELIYKTGDLVKRDANGNLKYLGRTDFQVKIRGFRIELGEIESNLIQMESIRLVVVHPIEVGGMKSLVAYVIPTRGEIAHSEIVSFLKEILPDYMIPSYTVNLKDFPLNSNGKIDRNNLPLPPLITEKSTREVGPNRGDVTETLTRLWKKTLHINEIGREDNFFESGGNSILAVQLVTAVKNTFYYEIPLSEFFLHPTIDRISKMIQSDKKNREEAVIPLQERGDLPPLFCIGGIELYAALATAMGEKRPVYGVYLPHEQKLLELIQNDTLELWEYQSIEKWAEGYLKEIERFYPIGAFHLLGVSFGGVIAYEMGRQIRKQGHSSPSLFILDSHLPSGRRFRKGYGRVLNLLRSLKERMTNSQKKENKTGEIKQETIIRIRDEINDRAMSIYDKKKPATKGDALLFISEADTYSRGIYYTPSLGWDKYIQGELEICTIPGDHLGILQYPGVEVMSQKINEYLKKKPL